MANIVQLKRSSVSGRIPDAANVEVGEPVINLADQIIFTKDGSGTVKVIGAGTTSNISEGTNLYFTNTRAVAALTAGTGISISANGLITATSTGDGTGGFTNSTLSVFPTGDYASGGDATEPYVTNAVNDAFGVQIGEDVYDSMEPVGRYEETDLGVLT